MCLKIVLGHKFWGNTALRKQCLKPGNVRYRSTNSLQPLPAPASLCINVFLLHLQQMILLFYCRISLLLHRLRPHFPHHLLRETVLHDLLYCWDTSPTGFHGGHWGLVGQRCEVQLQPDLLPVVSDPEKGPRNAPGCGEKQESGWTLSRRNWKRKVCCSIRDKRNLDSLSPKAMFACKSCPKQCPKVR